MRVRFSQPVIPGAAKRPRWQQCLRVPWLARGARPRGGLRRGGGYMDHSDVAPEVGWSRDADSKVRKWGEMTDEAEEEVFNPVGLPAYRPPPFKRLHKPICWSRAWCFAFRTTSQNFFVGMAVALRQVKGQIVPCGFWPRVRMGIVLHEQRPARLGFCQVCAPIWNNQREQLLTFHRRGLSHSTRPL